MLKMKTYIICKKHDVGIGHYFLAWTVLFEKLSTENIIVLLDLRGSNLQYKYGDYLPNNDEKDYNDILHASDNIQPEEKFINYKWIVQNMEKKSVFITDTSRVLLVKPLSHVPYYKSHKFDVSIGKMFTKPLSDIIFPNVDCVLHIRSGDSHLINKKIDEEKFGSTSNETICSMVRMWVKKLEIDTKPFHCIGDNNKVVDYVRNNFESCVSWQSEPNSHSMHNVNTAMWSDGMSIVHANKVVTLSAYDWGSNFTRFWTSIGNTKCEHYRLIPMPKKLRCICKKQNGQRCTNYKLFNVLSCPKEYKCIHHEYSSDHHKEN